MKRFLVAAALVVTPVIAFAQPVPDHGPNTSDVAGTAANAESLVTLIIPEIVGVEVHNDLVFDLGQYVAAAPGCTNYFPATTACATATYDPTDGTGGNVGISFLSTNATPDIAAYIPGWDPASTNAAGPGFPTTSFRFTPGTTTDVNFWPAGPTAFPLAAAPAAAVGPFNWTREDMDVQLVIANPGTVDYLAGTFYALINVDISF